MAQRVFWCICLLSLLSIVSGCGNKGPLFLPEDEMPSTQLDAMPDTVSGTTPVGDEPPSGAEAEEVVIDDADATPADDEQGSKKSTQRQ